MPTDQEAAQELLSRRRARRDLAEFTAYTFPAFKMGPHHRYIAGKLELVESGKIRRMFILAPRRHAKSEIASRRFPAWFLGRNPTQQIITTSYGDQVAEDLGRDVRNIIDSVAYRSLSGVHPFHHVHLRQDSTAASRFHTTQGGIYTAASIGGAIAGRGSDILLVDDPHKNMDEARNPRMQQHVYDYYREALLPTLMPDGAVIIVMSRWAEGDLYSRIMSDPETDPNEWEIVRLPAYAEKDDPLGRLEGEVLCPEWMSKDELEKKRREQGTRAFEAMYQQAPRRQIEGALWTQDVIDRNRVSSAPEDMIRFGVALDPSVTSTRESDEAGIVAGGMGPDGHVYIVKDASGILSPDDWIRRGVHLYDLHQADWIIGEVNNGGDLIESLLRTVDKRVRYEAVRASRGKVTRAEPVQALYARGMVHHVGRFPKLEEQMTTWVPIHEKSPDRIDALVWLVTKLLLKPAVKVL